MVPKQRLDKLSWEWAETVDPDEVQWEHVELAYRVTLKPCLPGTCKRNCKGNPFCLLGLGEKDWLCEIDDSNWHDIDDPDTEIRKKGGFVGLKNLGATCYMNTFLQVWFHNREFRAAIYKWKDPILDSESHEQPHASQQLSPAGDTPETVPANSVTGQLQLIFAMLQFSNRKYVDPTQFINALGLDAGQQQDAQEFSKLLMSLLEDTFRQQRDPSLCTVIQKMFLGHYDYVTRCTKCKSESHRRSKFYEFDLNIKGHSTLKDCIEEFLKEEKLDKDNQYMCAVCDGKQNAVRQIDLCSLPPVLNFQLLRFVFDRKSSCKRKLNTFIQFPEVLDMSSYVSRPDEELQYDLQAVLIHRGPSANSGHYISYICDSTSNLWSKFNDEDIAQMGGKNLQLGNEEELHLSDGGSKSAKKLRTSKGFHASRNAYMLVYRQRHSRESERAMPETQLSSLPEPIQRGIEQDNGIFEQWIDEIKSMRDVSVLQGKARHTEMFQLCHIMPVVKGEPWEWIDSKWLTKWFSCDNAADVPVVDNSALVCPHSRLHPDKVPNAKCISRKASDIIYTTYGGGPRLLSDDLCIHCVRERCKVVRTNAKVAEDSKLISSMLKNKRVPPTADSYWVGKASLRSWKRLVVEQLKEDAARAEDMQIDDPSKLEDKKMEDGGTGSELDDSFFFNEDLLCELHGNLTIDEGCRRLIPGDIWFRLKSYFPDSPEFTGAAELCHECLEETIRTQEVKDMNNSLRTEQKTLLSDLYLNKHRPTWGHGVEQLIVIPPDFLDSWRRFIREPKKMQPLKHIHNDSLLCKHGGLLFRPQTIGADEDSDRAVYIWPSEWDILRKYVSVDKEVWVTRVEEEDGPITFIASPDICEECCQARVAEQFELRLTYSSATIYVRKVIDNKVKKQDDPTTTSNPVELTESEDDYSANESSSSASTQNGKRKKHVDDVTVPEKVTRLEPSGGATGQVPRRSTRHHRIRGEKEVQVSSTQTLRMVKLEILNRKLSIEKKKDAQLQPDSQQELEKAHAAWNMQGETAQVIMRLFSVAPFDQNLTLETGQCLHDDKATLADLHILPGSLIYLKVDEPVEDPMFLDDTTKADHPELGFKGTGLQGR